MLGLVWGALAAIGFRLLLLQPSTRSRFRSNRHVFELNGFYGFVATDFAWALLVGCVVWLIQVPALSLITFATTIFSLRQRRLARDLKVLDERSAAWPDAIDFLISSVRAGVSVGPSLMALYEQGPDVLKPILLPTREALSQGATTAHALNLLKSHARDPVADRLVLILEISQSVGGSSLATILRSLSNYVRAESRTRAELLSRQSWTTNAAKLAVVAPWLIVLLLSIRAHDAYATPSGSLLLLVGSLATSLGYGWMRRAARLPVAARLA